MLHPHGAEPSRRATCAICSLPVPQSLCVQMGLTIFAYLPRGHRDQQGTEKRLGGAQASPPCTPGARGPRDPEGGGVKSTYWQNFLPFRTSSSLAGPPSSRRAGLPLGSLQFCHTSLTNRLLKNMFYCAWYLIRFKSLCQYAAYMVLLMLSCYIRLLHCDSII